MDWTPLWVTLRLATTTSVLLLVVALPLAWWLATTHTRLKPLAEAITALPLVLPPTVLGFYLLVLFSPQTMLGGAWVRLTGETLSFSFTGLVVASMIYSFPFAVQPLQAAFEAMGRGPLEAASTLGARPVDVFFSVALPQARRGILTAGVLSFAHTVGEFGVVLMVGGNIPGRTRVISIDVYGKVETLDYAGAHLLSAGLLVFSFAVLVLVYGLNRRAIANVR